MIFPKHYVSDYEQAKYEMEVKGRCMCMGGGGCLWSEAVTCVIQVQKRPGSVQGAGEASS